MRLLAGLCSRIAHATGADQVPAVKETLGRISAQEAMIAGMVNGQINAFESWPGGPEGYHRGVRRQSDRDAAPGDRSAEHLFRPIHRPVLPEVFQGTGDGAGWHEKSKELVVPGNITLITLPPYSPELNPMENVWEFLRDNRFGAQVWKTYGAIVQACSKAWNWFVSDPLRIASIGTREWVIL